MVLTKESDFYKVLKEVVNSVSETKGFSTEIQSIIFLKEKGIILRFSDENNENNKNIKIFDKNIDFSTAVNSSVFIPFVIDKFENENEVKFTLTNGYVYIDDIKFKAVDIELDEITEDEKKPIINFSTEQFKKLEKDFKFSSENYYKDSSLTDTILFGINNGELYEVASGVCGYKLSKFDGTEDEVALQQLAGHSKILFALPHFYFNILKNINQNVSVTINNSLSAYVHILLKSENIEIRYKTTKLRTDLFEEHIKWFAQTISGIKISEIPEVIKIANILAKYNYQTAEDKEFFFKIKDKTLFIDAEDLKLKYDCNIEQNFRAGINSATAFSYIASQLSDDAIIAKNNAESERLFIKDKNSFYSIYDSSSDYYTD